MDDITLDTICNSVEQLNYRIDDINSRIGETNSTIRIFIAENNKAHRDGGRQMEQVCRLISKCEKNASVTKQRFEDHLRVHKKEDSKANINGVKVTTILSSFGSALIGAFAALYAAGMT